MYWYSQIRKNRFVNINQQIAKLSNPVNGKMNGLPPYFLCRRKRGKSGKCTDVAGVQPGIKLAELYSFCTKKWKCFHMRNPNLLPYETIVWRPAGEPEAVDEVAGRESGCT